MWLRQEVRKVPLRTYTLLAITTVATMGFSNASLGYLNYPTQVTLTWGQKWNITLVPQVIFKCCKLIPVLVGGILIQGKKYGLMDFTAAGNWFILKIEFNTTQKTKVAPPRIKIKVKDDVNLTDDDDRFDVPRTYLLHPRWQQGGATLKYKLKKLKLFKF